MNFANYVDFAARDAPEKVAVADPTRSLTFDELAAETNAVANGLEDLGVEAGDRVAMYVPNGVTFVTTYFGAMKRGAIPFPINMRFEGEEIEYVLDDSASSVVVTTGAFEDAITALDVESVENVVVAGGSKGIDYESFVADADTDYDVHPRKEGELAELMYTSGTTGRPKGVRHTHGNVNTNALGLIRYVEWSEHDVGLTVCPCFHVSGLNITVTPFVVLGATNYLLPSWDPETTLEYIEEMGVTYTFFIPTMVTDLLEADTGAYDTSTLENVGVGGAPMPRERIAAVESALGCTLLEGYGMTETSPLAAVNLPGEDAVRKPGSIGPVSKEVVDVRIEDPETGEEVGRNEKGELLWYGDTITPGYYKMDEKNRRAFVERDGKRWLRSGDIGRMDEDGHLFIEDRVDDMIITGGENVYPREVEDVLYAIDGVVEAAVFGTPDDRLGETITATVVPETGSDLTVEAIERACREADLAGYKLPRRIEFVEEMPKTSTRKIDKVALRERFGSA